MSNTITYGGVVFLCHKEPCEVRKGKDDVILYYTRQDTGESGMSVQSLASACGVSRPALDKLFKTLIFEGATKHDKNADKELNYKENDGATSLSNSKDIEKEAANQPTDFYLIKAVEVKRVANFEIAFGQLLRYRAQLQETIYATKTYMLYLFGDVTDDERRILQAMAKLADFQLMIECNLTDYMDANEMSNRDRLHIVISNEDAAVA